MCDVQNGKLIEGWKETQALTPASTTKALTTYALMKIWKPNYTVPTEIWGDLTRRPVKGDLIFKGAGDPLHDRRTNLDIAEDSRRPASSA